MTIDTINKDLEIAYDRYSKQFKIDLSGFEKGSCIWINHEQAKMLLDYLRRMLKE